MWHAPKRKKVNRADRRFRSKLVGEMYERIAETDFTKEYGGGLQRHEVTEMGKQPILKENEERFILADNVEELIKG
ncbi:hypothetical protein N9K75_02605 [bacterium]|nr:hypothetical protein [bacterium]